MTPLYRKGDRLEMVFMPDDPDPIRPGTKGTVACDSVWLWDGWQTAMHWDNGRCLALWSPVDQVKVIL